MECKRKCCDELPALSDENKKVSYVCEICGIEGPSFCWADEVRDGGSGDKATKKAQEAWDTGIESQIKSINPTSEKEPKT